MKLFIFLFSLSIFSLSSIEGFSQNAKINIEKNQIASVDEVFKLIKKQTDYTFIYRADLFENYPKISLEKGIINVKELLNKTLSNGKFIYEFAKNNTILVKSNNTRSVQEQVHVVRGYVTDEGEIPLPGVTVMIKGSKRGVTTDFEGKYSIKSKDTDTLVFSYIGFVKKEVLVNGNKKINVQLVANISELDEVVITGIVKRDKKSFTGATTTVTTEDLKVIGNSNIIESLKTLDPSFIIVENNILGSDPNQLSDIEVRGKTSLSTDGLADEFGANPNQPLFILDGFETTLRVITDLDMNRVASITILKDASSTALYGAKAANGVIVVETLRPTSGKLQVTYNADFRVEMPDLSDYNLMNSTQKLEYERLSGLWNTSSVLNQFKLDKQYNATLAEIKRGVDTYWLNEPVRVGSTLSHSLYASGGGDAVTFGVGLNYKSLQGVMKGSDRETWGANFNLRYRKDKLNISNNLYINGYDANDSPYGSFSNFATANPYFKKTDEEGNITKYLDIDDYYGTAIVNPLYNGSLNSLDNTRNLQITNNLRAIWTLNSKFRIQSNLQLNKSITTLETFLQPEHSSFRNTTILERGAYTNQRTDMFSYKLNMMVSYANLFKEKHTLTANLRGEIEETDNKRISFSAIGYPSGTSGNPSFAYSYPDSNPSAINSNYRRVNVLASVNYDFDRTLLFDATYRLDGSTVFGSNERYSPFWAIGGGINLNNALNMDPGKVSQLKLRGNVGSTGNQGFGNLSSVSIYGFIQDVNIFGQATDLSILANPDLQWQNTLQTSVGIDGTFFNNRLHTTLNAFSKDTDPLIVRIDLPSSTGIVDYPINAGNMNTKGLEAIIKFSPIYKLNQQVIWTLGVTASAIKSEYGGFNATLESLNEDALASQSLLRYRDGYSPDDLWTVESLGIDPANGLEVFLTEEGTPTYEYDSNDEKVMGNSRPTVEGIISSNLRIKNFTMGVNLRYRFGGDVLNTALYNKVENISETQRIQNQDVRALTDRWITPGDISGFKSIADFSTTPLSSRFIQEENVIIGESINFGYEFKNKPWVRQMGLSRVRLNAYMNEIFRISTIKTERGINYPFARAVSFSLNASF
ncbi:SusC/RagA family TonB-linked outer membrane protein [Polaribacter sp. Asnod1-A03]|uniref:SusC/RagA family TonB-linked outer membrane protein n=1 Tax=Polaribacter sp. Asnod1-A03 TaxID=3160581 RepID=UPI00386AB846